MKTLIKIITSLILGFLWVSVLAFFGDLVSLIASQVIGFIVFFACVLFITLKPLQKKLESPSYGTVASIACSGLSSILFLFLYNKSWYEDSYAVVIYILTGACIYLAAGKFGKK